MKGRVIQVLNHECLIEQENYSQITAMIKGHFKQEIKSNSNFIKVGDLVEFIEKDKHFRIVKRYDRKNKLCRLQPGSKSTEQVIAANIDQLLIVTSFIEPQLKTGVIDRFIAAAELFHIPIILFFNKADLIDKKQFKWLVDYYKTIVRDAVVGSTKDLKTINKILQLLENKVTVIGGQSGVGKTSLVNALDSELDLKVNAISEYNQKGKHTTSSAFFYRLKLKNIAIIDTPGIKEFSMINVSSNELYRYFPEMMELSNSCKFYNCTHINEPNCAIKEAVEIGAMALFRYESYSYIFNELREKEKNKWR